MQNIIQKQAGGGNVDTADLFQSVLKSLDFIGFTGEYMSSQLDSLIGNSNQANKYLATIAGALSLSKGGDPFANIQEDLGDLSPAPRKANKQEDAMSAYWGGMVGGNALAAAPAAPKPAPTADAEEKQTEYDKREEYKIKLLEIIAKNTEGGFGGKDKDKKDDKKGLGLGTIGTLLVGGAYVLMGYVRMFLKLVKEVAKPFIAIVEYFSQMIKDSKWFVGLISKIRKLWFSAVYAVSEIVRPLEKAFESIKGIGAGIVGEVTRVAKLVTSFVTESKLIMGVFSKIKSLFSAIVKPFVAVGESLGVFEKITKVFGEAMSVFSKSGKFFKLLGVAGKALSWLTGVGEIIFIIEGLWDTISGAIEGWKEGGVWGAFVGAFDGLVGKLIGGFADTIKDIISWILDKIGLGGISKWLDSFSFEGMVHDLAEAFMHPVDTFVKMWDGLLNSIQNIEIPKIEFTIPFIDKKISIGPFHPLAPSRPAPAAPTPAPAPAAAAPAQSTASAVAAPAPGGRGTPTPTKSATAPAVAPAPTATPKSAAPAVAPPAASTTTAAASTAPKVADDWSTGTEGQKMTESLKQAILKMTDDNARRAIAAWRVLTNTKESATARAGAGDILDQLTKKTTPATAAASGPSVAPSGANTGNQISQMSADNAAAAQAPAASNTVVNAPTVNNTTNQTMVSPPPPTRNSESSLQQYNRSRYAF